MRTSRLPSGVSPSAVWGELIWRLEGHNNPFRWLLRDLDRRRESEHRIGANGPLWGSQVILQTEQTQLRLRMQGSPVFNRDLSRGNFRSNCIGA